MALLVFKNFAICFLTDSLDSMNGLTRSMMHASQLSLDDGGTNEKPARHIIVVIIVRRERESQGQWLEQLPTRP